MGQYVCQESENKGRGAVSLFRWGEALITSTGAVKCWIGLGGNKILNTSASLLKHIDAYIYVCVYVHNLGLNVTEHNL